MTAVGRRVGIRGKYKVMNVPMADGRRCRFRVYDDGAVYEIRGAGQRRVGQEPFRTELFDTCWPVDTPEELVAVQSRRPVIALIIGGAVLAFMLARVVMAVLS